MATGCAGNGDCPAGLHVCDTSQNPHACVQCLQNSDCSNGDLCDTAARTCHAPPVGGANPRSTDVPHLSWRNYLRIGLVLTLSGIIVLAHYGISSAGRLPHHVEPIVGIVLLVAGLPLIVMAVVRRRS